MLDYEKLAEVTTSISEYSRAVAHLNNLAQKLMDNETELDVEVCLKEVISLDKQSRFNELNSDIGLQINEDTLIYRCGSQNDRKPKLFGIRQPNMPREVALIIIDKVNKWYLEQIALNKKELLSIIAPIKTPEIV